MTTRRIALLPGDGIGTEVVSAAIRVLDAAGFEAEYLHADVGWHYWRTEGDALPARTIELLRRCDAALFGAITSKPAEEAANELSPVLRARGLKYASPIVRLRQLFDLHTALRPCRAYAGNPRNIRDDIDIVVFRENTEGLYGGIEWHPLPESVARAMADETHGHPTKMRRWFDAGLENVALSTRFISRQGCERIVRAAFRFAVSHARRRVTLFEKPNVLRETGGLFTRIFRQVAAEFPAIEAREANIDSACMQMVTDPGRFDVVVAENMFGDIVSDLAAGLVGGLGFAPSANIGGRFAVFEPTHGSAPDIAGRGIANPIAAVLAARMMLQWLGEREIADRVESAVASLIADGQANTPDVAGSDAPGTTESITQNLIERLAHQPV